jgi:hypothetical protein
MLAPQPDIVRLQPSLDSLKVILRNTHFRNDILEEPAKIALHIDHHHAIPVIVVRFAEPYYDFIAPLRLPSSEKQAWFYCPVITIKLILSDSVISDQLSTRIFRLGIEESDVLRTSMEAQLSLSYLQLDEIEKVIANEYWY